MEQEPEYTKGYNESISNCNMQQLMFLDDNRLYKCNCIYWFRPVTRSKLLPIYSKF